MNSKEEYSQEEFVKSVVVFKQLMHPSKTKWLRVFKLLDLNNQGYFSLRDLRRYIEEDSKNLANFDSFIEAKVLDTKVDERQFVNFILLNNF